MNGPFHDKTRLPDVRVPTALLSAPDRFGGAQTEGYLTGDLILRDGRAEGLAPATGAHPARLVIPRLTEAHVHLDKCHTVDRLPAVGGDLRAAINAQWDDKKNWTEADLRDRAARGLEELIAAGCKRVRSHVDWTHGAEARTPPVAWHVLRELAQDYAGRIDLQLAPLTSLADLADSDTGQSIAREAAGAQAALGAFVLDHSAREAGIRAAVALAQTHDLPLDFHVDEGLEDGLDGLALIARVVIETGFDRPVLCGHACSLINLTGDALEARLAVVARAGLHVVTLPSTNLYLQGRGNGTPDRRGLTRIRELQDAGIPVSVGTDNVRDAFCPVGQHDPRAALALAVLAGHLDPPLARLWPMITTQADAALGAPPLHVDRAGIDDLLIFEAGSTTAALAGPAPPKPLSTSLERSL